VNYFRHTGSPGTLPSERRDNRYPHGAGVPEILHHGQKPRIQQQTAAGRDKDPQENERKEQALVGIRNSGSA
jgi:hypothetical protein